MLLCAPSSQCTLFEAITVCRASNEYWFLKLQTFLSSAISLKFTDGFFSVYWNKFSRSKCKKTHKLHKLKEHKWWIPAESASTILIKTKRRRISGVSRYPQYVCLQLQLTGRCRVHEAQQRSHVVITAGRQDKLLNDEQGVFATLAVLHDVVNATRATELSEQSCKKRRKHKT